MKKVSLVLGLVLGLIPGMSLQGLAQNSAPDTSTIGFLVRKGNPKNIED